MPQQSGFLVRVADVLCWLGRLTGAGSEPRQCLLVSLDDETLDCIAEACRQEDYSVSAVMSGEGAVGLLREASFDLVVTGGRLPDMPLGALVDVLRGRSCGSRSASMMVVARPEDRAQAQQLVGRGVNSVLVRNAWCTILHDATARLLRRSPRAVPTDVVNAFVATEESPSPVPCQVVNFSTTGVLVYGMVAPRVGTPCRVLFQRDAHGGEALRARGWVVRHVAQEDPTAGFAILLEGNGYGALGPLDSLLT